MGYEYGNNPKRFLGSRRSSIIPVVRRLVGRSVGRLVGWSVGRSVGRSVCHLIEIQTIKDMN